MIDWLAASRCTAELQESPARTQAALAQAVAAAPCFQNTDFPLPPMPLYAAHAAAASVLHDLEAYVTLLGRITGLYREHAEIRRWYGLGPAAESLILADTRLGDTVPVCRLDGYLEQGTERLWLLENNADAPAGTLFSPRINGIARGLLAELGVQTPELSPLTFSAEMALPDTLTVLLKQAGQTVGDPRVAVLQFTGAANRESHELVRTLRAAGLFAIVADPRDMQVRSGRVCFGGEPVDVCWNKINTVGWRAVVEPDQDLCPRWSAVLRDAPFVHVNPFGARYIAESKLTLTMPREPAFTGLFSAAEHALLDRLLPWARRVTREATAADGTSSLFDEISGRPGDYVIKEPYDIRGDGVTVGRAVSQRDWTDAVARALANQLVAQRYVAPSAYPVIQAEQVPGVVCMPISFDTFVMDGQVCGFGSKASLNARVNVFQGGRKLAVHVTRERR
jgi:hypothetical protein